MPIRPARARGRILETDVHSLHAHNELIPPVFRFTLYLLDGLVEHVEGEGAILIVDDTMDHQVVVNALHKRRCRGLTSPCLIPVSLVPFRHVCCDMEEEVAWVLPPHLPFFK
eukprot:CAMPEP_0118988190 /NCGR_PEP_ID=MMETSP1173-20130426/45693_1 /TAXON_ID=1034831 /ORGANISM="Rhizochromulina marina cf, Strain CCMP1243" /LENGTH=111 /DNA_ID=CAMNT_0006939103 /DNA_START=520 /DNA_END=855 /DNA_ORIENTATION=+